MMETVASRGLRIVSGASGMEGRQGLGATRGSLLAVQVKGETAAELLCGADRVDAALRLAETPVARVRPHARRSQQVVVQEQQRLVQRRALQFCPRPYPDA